MRAALLQSLVSRKTPPTVAKVRGYVNQFVESYGVYPAILEVPSALFDGLFMECVTGGFDTAMGTDPGERSFTVTFDDDPIRVVLVPGRTDVALCADAACGA